MTVSANFGKNWFSFLKVVKENVKIPIGSNVKLWRAMAAILDGARQNRTQLLKGTIQGPFHQSLVKIGWAVSEELMKMWKVYDDDDDGRKVMRKAHMAF